MSYRPGGFWRICDKSGFKVRASETRKEWTGAIVHKDFYEERHPQDFVRGMVDHQAVPEPRPDPVSVFGGPLITTTSAAAVAGATTINLTSSERFEIGDRIGISLAMGDTHRAVVATVPGPTSITITAGTKLSGAVSSGANVIDYDAVAEAILE